MKQKYTYIISPPEPRYKLPKLLLVLERETKTDRENPRWGGTGVAH